MVEPSERPAGELVVLPAGDRPARFEPWPEDAKERCRALWGTLGNRNASRVEWLYGREVPEGVAVPAASTIRRWAHDDDWEAWANGDLERTRGKTLRQLQITWLRAFQISQETMIDAMLGRFDDNPAGGAVRVKAAEAVQRVVAQAGLLAPAPPEPEPEPTDTDGLPRAQKEEIAMRAITRPKRGRRP